MLIKRAALAACLPATTSDDTRYFLKALNITPDGKVQSTNGHVAIVAIDLATFTDDDFPMIDGAAFVSSPAGNTLLDAVNAKALMAVMPKRSTIAVLQTIQISQQDADTVTIAATDLATRSVQRIDLKDVQTFPALDRMMPAKDAPNTLKCALSVEVLETICKAAKAAGSAKSPVITFAFPLDAKKTIGDQPGVTSAIRFDLTGTEVTIEGVAMPCKV